MDFKKVALYGFFGIAGLSALAVGLYIKNSLEEKSIKKLDKDDVVKLLKLVRKERYPLYKQIATFAMNISQQMRGNINIEMIAAYINGPESPLKFQDESERIISIVCESNGTTIEAFSLSLDQFKNEKQISVLLAQQETDYKTSLQGRFISFNAKIPAFLTVEKIIELQNLITKNVIIKQVRMFRIIVNHTEAQIQANPSLLKDIGDPEQENEQLLRKENLEGQFEPALAVYQSAIMEKRKNPELQRKIQQIENGYQQILAKYIPRVQNKTITEAELNNLEEEIIYFNPI